MSLTEPRLTYKPFEYPEAHDYFKQHEQSHWTEWEVAMGSTVQDWSEKLSETDKKVSAGVLLGFTQSEILIGNNWAQKVSVWFPKPEINMMANSFASREGTHGSAYNLLNTTLGLEEHDAFLKDPIAAAKLNNLIERPIYTLKDKALYLAVYSGFGEGVSLYSSFAILLHFATRNLMKGLADIIAWSVVDECMTPDTEVLTSKGWARFDSLKGDEELAQFDMETKEITFARPSRLVIKPYIGKMIKFGGEKMCLKANVTENHDMVCKYDYAATYAKRKANELKLDPKMMVPLAGYKSAGELKHLSVIDRFRIALQADGTMSNRYTGSTCGTIPIMFTFSKQRKIDRLVSILNELDYSYTVTPLNDENGNRKARTCFKVNVPIKDQMSKTLDWVDLSEVTAQWATEFVDELQYWDGYTSKDNNHIYYSSTVSKNVDVIQAVCALGGLSTSRCVQIDNRSEAFSDVHRLHIHNRDYKRLGQVTKEVYDYEGLVYCATMEKGTLVTRYDNSVSITGNCTHSEAGCWLYRQLIAENPELYADTDLKEKVYEAFRIGVQLEHDFVSQKVFNGLRLPAGSHNDDKGLGAEEVNAFIEHRANLKLQDLGLEPIFTPDPEIVDSVAGWFYTTTAGLSNTDFFAARVTSYAKGTFNTDRIDWDIVLKPYGNTTEELATPARTI